MPTGKRASMREGPLADLFRKTAEDTRRRRQPSRARGRGARGRSRSPDPRPEPAGRGAQPRRREAAEPRRSARRRRHRGPAPPSLTRPSTAPGRRRGAAPPVPSPQERLRAAFSADIPENVLERPAPAAAPRGRAPGRAGARCPRPSATSTPARTAADPFPAPPQLGHPVLRVVGVGGAGVNAVNRMVEAEVEGVEFLAINTDLQSLQLSAAHETLHIGDGLTRGLGSGSDPELGRRAAREEYDRIKAMLRGSDMVFIAAGAGGGTGTGAAPDRGPDRPRARRADRRHRHAAVPVRGLAPARAGRGRHRRARRGGRHADRRAQQPAAVGAGPRHLDGRGLPRRRRRAAPGRPGHL